jgi:hypothetical protein
MTSAPASAEPPSETMLPYVPSSSTAWDKLAASTATVEVVPDQVQPEQLLVTGDCPRCGHATVWREPLVKFAGLKGKHLLSGLLSRATPETERDFEVICECGEAHPGQDHRYGCGASWSLHVVWR